MKTKTIPMLSDTVFTNLTAVLIGCVMFLLFITHKRRGRDFPPGPKAWPVLGNLPQLRGNILDVSANLQKQYGDVYSLYMGNMLTVFVHGVDAIKDVLVTKGDDFIDRPKLFTTDALCRGKGVACSNGEIWKQQRRFTLHTLRNFGFGRTGLEGKVMEEVDVLLKCLGDTRGMNFSIGSLIHISVSNVICSIVSGSRFEHDDPEFKEFIRTVEENMSSIGVGALNFLPWLHHLPGDLFHYHRTTRNVDKINAFIKSHVEEHKKTFDPTNLRDFIDGYLAEMEQLDDPDSTFEDEQLLKVVVDLFVAGSETSATTLTWSLLYLMHNPEIQTKIREEIHSVVGKSRLPSMADRKQMPYVEASLMEIQRCADIAYLGIPRSATVDTTLNGYTIPKDTIIMPVFTSLHKDPNVWKNPETFDPRRFLDSDGNVVKRESFLPFSAGKRGCPGESLAKMQLFLFLTSMLQRFVFKFPTGVTSLPLEATLGIGRAPLPFKLRAVLDV